MCRPLSFDEASMSATDSALQLERHIFKKGLLGQENTIKIGVWEKRPSEKSFFSSRFLESIAAPPKPASQQMGAYLAQRRRPFYGCPSQILTVLGLALSSNVVLPAQPSEL